MWIDAGAVFGGPFHDRASTTNRYHRMRAKARVVVMVLIAILLLYFMGFIAFGLCTHTGSRGPYYDMEHGAPATAPALFSRL